MSPLRQRLPKNVGFTKAELKRYLDYIGALGGPQGYGCVLCRQEAEVAHVKYGEPCRTCVGFGKEIRTTNSEDHISAFEFRTHPCVDCDATGYRYAKLSDLRQHVWTLPLCPAHHRLGNEAQHRHNEREWWADQGLDPLSLCVALQDAWNTALSRADAIEGGVAVLEEFRGAS